MNAFFNKKTSYHNPSRKEVIDSIKISIEKNDKALEYLNSLEVAEVYKEHIEYLKVVCKHVGKNYVDTLKQMGVKV